MLQEIRSSRPRLVGTFIRKRREAVGLSQRSLGLLFNPPVTTQFVSNLERGVTPLPLHHVPTLCKALSVNEAEIMSLLEKEYTLKVSGRLGLAPGEVPLANGDGSLNVSAEDYGWLSDVYRSFSKADAKTKQAFITVCESFFGNHSK
jgi:transcriptional regulator with XRE-family HTH domain